MRPRTKSALLWGLVGVFSFLVLHQGYLLVGGDLISIPAVAGIALVVGLATAATAYTLEVRLLRYGR